MCKNIQNVYKFHVYRLTAELLHRLPPHTHLVNRVMCKKSSERFYLAYKEQQVSMAGEVHGEEEQGQFLYYRDAAFMGQSKRQRFDFWSFLSHCGLRVQSRAWPFSRPPETN